MAFNSAGNFTMRPEMANLNSIQLAHQQPAPQAAPPQQTMPDTRPQQMRQMPQQQQQPYQQQQQNYMPRMMSYPMQPQQPQQSVVQSVNNSNPQSVQNFMSALGQVGAGHNNNMFNAPGQQGQQAQGGFQGFQQNGQAPQQLGYQGYIGQMPSQLGYQGNMSQLGQMQYANNGAQQGVYGNAKAPQTYNGGVASGGTGGVNGQPLWQTAGSWGQPLNAPAGTQGSQWSTYEQELFGHDAPAMGGSFYSPNAPTANGQPGKSTQQEQSDTAKKQWVGDPEYAPTTPYQPGVGYGGPGYNYNIPQSTTAPKPPDPNYFATSDVNAKTNIESGKGDLQDFLDALGVYSYEYKDPQAHGEGRRISPMAQEIESTKLGKDAVFTHNGVKAVDYGKLLGTQLSATALLNNKIKDLESKLSAAIKNKFKK